MAKPLTVKSGVKRKWWLKPSRQFFICSFRTERTWKDLELEGYDFSVSLCTENSARTATLICWLNLNRDERLLIPSWNCLSFWKMFLNRKIELVTIESLSPYLGPHILKEVEYASLAAWISSPHSWRDRIPAGRKAGGLQSLPSLFYKPPYLSVTFKKHLRYF